MGRFISLMIFLVEYLLVVHILLLSAMAHGSELEAAPNVQQQQQQLNIVNRKIGFESEEQGIIADAPAGSSTPEPSETETSTTAEGPDIRRMGKEYRHHRSSDKSEAGGGLIIGGLATAIFAAVFCYIRVTRKSSSTDDHMGSSSTMAVRETTRKEGTDGTTSAALSSSTI